MAENTNTEREALEAYLKDCDKCQIVPDVGGAWHAAFQAGRASLSLPAAGQEPVAWMDDRGLVVSASWLASDDATSDYRAAYNIPLAAAPQPPAAAQEPVAIVKWRIGGKVVHLVGDVEIGALLYTHPSPPEGAGWINLPGTPPEPGTPVLLDIGKKYPIRAMWAAKHTVEAHDEASPEWVDYDDVTDAVYCPEGWYEWNENEEVHWAVNAKPRAWMAMPLPAPPASEAKEA